MKLLAISLTAPFLLFACAPIGNDSSDDGLDESGNVATTSEALMWDPGTALMTEHRNWHTQPCGRNGGRSCTLRGEDFLKFHHSFIERLRDAYEAKGVSADITPWYRVPSEIINSGMWTPDDAAAEQAVLTLIDPATHKRFASLDRFGTYMEGFYHAHLHNYSAVVFKDPALANAAESPRSSYFLKIHGLIDWNFMRFINGDFNNDGMSDIVTYDQADGSRGFSKMVGTNFEVANLSIPALPAGCNWTLGATADLDANGAKDLIYHAPDCSGRLIARMMNGARPYSPLPLPGGLVEMGNVGGDWRLIGSADFNNDARPDLVWGDSSSQAVVWFMNNFSIVSSRTYSLPSGMNAVLSADFDANGHPDLLTAKMAGDGGMDHYILYNGEGTPLRVAGISRSPYRQVIGAGYFSSNSDSALGTQTRRQVDLLFQTRGPGSPSTTYNFALSTAIDGSGNVQYGPEIALPLPERSWSFSGVR